MSGLLRMVGWLFAIVLSTVPSFWLVVHPRAVYWRARRRSPYRVLVPVWIAMWIAVGALTWPWRHVLLYDSPFPWITSLFFFGAGIFLYVRSWGHFGPTELAGRPELEPERHAQRLVTTGIRQRVRHPIYLAHLCELLGWSIGTGMVLIYGLTAFAMLTGWLMIRLEDRELEQRFGEEFRAYRYHVPAILPRIFLRDTGSHEAHRAL